MSNQSSVESLFYKMFQSFELFDSKQLTYQEYAKEILQHKKQAKSQHITESVDFALYAMMAESFNDLPEATKNQLREAIEVKYKEYYKL